MTLDLSKNQVVKLKGLESIQSLRFLNLSLNQVYKVRQLIYIEQLPLLTELEMCFNPIMDKKLYRLQMLFHIPQLRMLDGIQIQAEEKIKAENLHGVDLADRETIFKALLPQENFVDRRLHGFEDIEAESDDNDGYVSIPQSKQGTSGNNSAVNQSMTTNSVARNYVGELIQQIVYVNGLPEFHDSV
jgi:protein phosphatase 1 regulatory subunit 7